jgi:hypothetical protein
MVTLTAQGFMIASLALLLTSGSPSASSKLEAIREYAPLVLSIVGLTVGVAGFISVFAARRSLGKAIEKWNAKQIESDARNRSDPYGGKLLHRMGGISAWTIASAFPVFWSVVMFAITSLQD